MSSFHILIRYSLIGVLLLGLYLLWNENQLLKSTLIQVTNQLNLTEEKYQKLQQTIFEQEQKLKKIATSKVQKEELSIKVNQNSQLKVNSKTKQIVIVLPEKEANYTAIIPKIDYKNIPLDKANTKEDNIKVSPEVFIDKDEKKINGGKIQIETKF